MTVTIRLRTIAWTMTGLMIGAVLAVLVLSAWRAEAAPGDEDSTFVPIPNCRLFDFRSPGGIGPKDTPLGPGEGNVHTQQVTGTNGDCTIPSEAVGVSMNVTIVNPTAQSNLRVFPADVPTPLASNLNWLAGQAATPNKVDVKLSSDGAIKLFNFQGNVDVLADAVGYYTDESLRELDARAAALDARVDELEALLADVSIEQVDGQRTVRFTGVNVQVVDGTGDTPCGGLDEEACSGRGNLLVGYQRNFSGSATRSGAHNLVIGDQHEWSSHSGAVVGLLNEISAPYAVVSGGEENTASGVGASVSGGIGNTANGDLASILGGQLNTAAGSASTVAGGTNNVVNGSLEVIVGGDGIPFCIDDPPLQVQSVVCGEGTISAAD